MAQQGVHSVSVIKHFCIERSILGGGGGGDSSGGHYRVRSAQLSQTGKCLTQFWRLTGLLEAGLTAPVSHDRKE